PTAASLEGLFAESGFAVVEQQSAAELHDPPADWERRTDDVEAEIKRLHEHEEAWRIAEQQSETMGDLVGSGAVAATLFSLRTTI
ncbi:SAM-dependent methyltransferase, partial [Mycobacterium sp. ITM-2017-0098]